MFHDALDQRVRTQLLVTIGKLHTLFVGVQFDHEPFNPRGESSFLH
jgi:hypothetical protein